MALNVRKIWVQATAPVQGTDEDTGNVICIGSLWYDTTSNALKKCSSLSPLTWSSSIEGGGSSSFVAGMIMLWSGTLASIPSGWVICDGQNGTPDLRDRFIKSVGTSEDPGATGGAATHAHADHASHTHTYTDIVNHTHPITDPGHVHTERYFPTATGGSIGYTADLSMSGTQTNTTLTTTSSTTGITTNNPSGGVATGTTAGPSATLTHDSVNHEPTYFKLAFIMKT